MTIAQRVTELRQQRGIGPAELSRRIGVKPSAVHLIETGATKTLKAETLLRLADVLEASPWYILWGQRTAGRGDMPSRYEAVPPAAGQEVRDESLDAKLQPLAFQRGLLAAHGANEESCSFIIAPDDSMRPAIPAGASVVYDRSDCNLRRGERFVVRVAGEILIRRCSGYGTAQTLVADRGGACDEPIRLTGDYEIEILGRVCCTVAWSDQE